MLEDKLFLVFKDFFDELFMIESEQLLVFPILLFQFIVGWHSISQLFPLLLLSWFLVAQTELL